MYLFNLVCAQIPNNTDSTTIISTVPSSTISTTVKTKENITCETHNNDCKACIAKSECYYCDEQNHCIYRLQSIIADGKCNIKDAYYLTCKISLKVMMILICILASIVLLIILIVCCYCCCKKKGIKLSKDDLKWARQKEERQQIAAERRKERAERTEEIRKKYGLVKDSNPYQKFDA